MPQVSRMLRSFCLSSLPAGLRRRLLDACPNWRKAAPEGMAFVYDRYLGDIRIHIDTRFLVERIAWTGSYEADFQNWVGRNIEPGSVVLDIGANVGAITLGLARQVGAAGRVYAFEPAPPNRQRLQANLDLNPDLAQRVTVLPMGLGKEAATLYWHEEPGNPGNGWLRPAGEEPVEVRTLDGVMGEQGLERLDFIKIDVEGMEWDIFQGATKTLKHWCPTLYFETLSRFREEGEGHAPILELLESLGYQFYRLQSDGSAEPLVAGKWPSYTLAVHASRV